MGISPGSSRIWRSRLTGCTRSTFVSAKESDYLLVEEIKDSVRTLFSDEGIYNTYVLDTDYKSWALIMHCAEKAKSPKYLSALLLARTPKLPINAINFLREKLPRYDIDTSFMFDIDQESCDTKGLPVSVLKPSGN